MDYQGNSNKDKDKSDEKKLPEKNIEKVVVGSVAVKKKSLGQKFKDLFIEADIKTVIRYVGSDVLLPALRNMIVDASTKGIERVMYGDRAARHRVYGPGPGPRITYNNPINRGGDWRDPATRPPRGSSAIVPRRNRNDFILSSREEAALVLERMNDIIDTYEVASVADLNDLVGFPTSHVDNKWGWMFLGDVQIRQVREGYLIDLPPAEPIQ